MRISDLARSTGVSLPTVKYYLREGLLPPGRPTAATQADYDSSHADRLRLIRALVDVGGLSLASVRSVLALIDAGPDRPGLAVGTVHEALSTHADAEHPGRPVGGEEGPRPVPERALAALHELGWCAHPESPTVRLLDAALDAVARVGIPMSQERLHAYADAALTVAEVDVASVPRTSTTDAVAHVVLGTVLYEPVLLALRRLAQAEVYVSGEAGTATTARRRPAPPAV
jgi:DNA-binding transcriptional MerR regulator